jgi:hypothetical protein
MMTGMDKSFFMRWSPNSLSRGFSVLLFLVSFAANPCANIQPTGSISIYKRLTAQSRNRLAPRNPATSLQLLKRNGASA